MKEQGYFKLLPDQMKQLKDEAEADGRPLANYVAWLLIRHLEGTHRITEEKS